MSEERQARHINGSLRIVRCRILKPYELPSGYHQVTLYLDDKKRHHYIHRLVLLAFHGDGGAMDSCHNDGSKSNNSLNNLRWDTRAGNFADKKRHGTHLEGDAHPGSKIKVAGVASIVSDTRLARVIAAEYGISTDYVHHLRSRKGRRHLLTK